MRVFLALRQETAILETGGKREEGRGKREDVGRNNTKNSTHQHQDFSSKLMREKT
ncbi:MAG: hypothetical protein F6K24_32845 [Okeania sp. SIO2D1]|nr:hypothetical protein [Okeania sp. SIO2D1]